MTLQLSRIALRSLYLHGKPHLNIALFDFDPKDFKKQVAKGVGDGALLAWITKAPRPKHPQSEIVGWSKWG
jgi:Domain of unknown function (DUF5069)